MPLAKSVRGLNKISHQIQEYIQLFGIKKKTQQTYKQVSGKIANELKHIQQSYIWCRNVPHLPEILEIYS